MTEFAADICPRCNEATEPDDHFPVAEGPAYHVRCYQAAIIEAGLPDPFPVCAGCKDIIWEHAGGELQVVVKGLIASDIDGKVEWLPARWHPDCAPEDESPVVGEVEPEPAPLDDNEPLRVRTNPETGVVEVVPGQVGEPEPEPEPTPENLSPYEGGYIPPPEAVALATATLPESQDFDDAGKPVCPVCGRAVQRSPYQIGNIIFHKTCAARQRVRMDPQASRRKLTKNPKCPACARGVTQRDHAEEKVVECEGEGGKLELWHKRCYRKAVVDSGGEDPFPPEAPVSGEEFKERMKRGRVRAEKARKEETVNCGICSQDILRSEYPAHIVPCAEKAKAEAERADA